MSRIVPETWTRLEAARPTGEALTARLAVPEATSRLQAALDADGVRHFLVRLAPDEVELLDTESRGLTVLTRELLVIGEPPARFLDVVCQDASGHAAFDLIGGELAEALAIGTLAPAVIAARVLAKWRRFWGQLPRQMLSREAQLGLFAELWFLVVWLLPRCGAAEAVRRWRGPYGARHDFEWPGKSVEVKATASVRGRIHRINGLDQLAPPQQGALSLFSLRVREEAGATNTLPALVARGRALLADDPESLGRWEAALSSAGYSPTHEEEYAKLKLRIVDEMLYAVRDDFPRLTLVSFPGGLPEGVTSVEYESHLDGFTHLALAEESGITAALA